MKTLIKHKVELFRLYNKLIEITRPYRKNKRNRNKSYVLFGALIGMLYKERGIMFLGRSSNGWHCYVDDEKSPFLFNESEILDGNGEQFVDSVANPLFDIPGKLTLLKENNRKSKVWQLISLLGQALCGKNWEQHIVYSNYCKIAPDEESSKLGTPPVGLINLQEEIVDEILRIELEVMLPQHIICYTGCTEGLDISERLMPILLAFYSGEDQSEKYNKEWRKYKNVEMIKDESLNSNLMEIYRIGDNYIYLLDYPQGKSPEAMAAAILKAKTLGYW